MNSQTYVVDGDVDTRVTVTELEDGSLKIDLEVLDDTGFIGDLGAMYFDLADDGLAESLSVSGEQVATSSFTGDVFAAFDQYEMSDAAYGAVGDTFDGGIELVSLGADGDGIQATTFYLSSSLRDLTVDDLVQQQIAIGVTSVSFVTSDDSEPEPDPDPAEEAEATPLDALDDILFVFDADRASGNTLDNDTGDMLAVSAVNGEAGNVGQAITVTSIGGRTGQLTIDADGMLLFDQLGNFSDLGQGEVDIVMVTYQATDGGGAFDTATTSLQIVGGNNSDEFLLG